MKGINLSEEELASMNYNDVAYVVLEKNSKTKFIDLFNNVTKVMGLDPAEAEEHITDFFELLSTDKRFIMLENGYWDLKVKHDKGMVISEDDDEEEEELPIEEENIEDEDYSDDDIDKDDDIEEDDLKDLVIIDENDEEIN